MSDPLHALLDLQAHDTTSDQHRHRRANLPERNELAVAERNLASIDAEIARVTAARDVLGRDQKRIEDDAAAFLPARSARRVAGHQQQTTGMAT